MDFAEMRESSFSDKKTDNRLSFLKSISSRFFCSLDLVRSFNSIASLSLQMPSCAFGCRKAFAFSWWILVVISPSFTWKDWAKSHSSIASFGLNCLVRRGRNGSSVLGLSELSGIETETESESFPGLARQTSLKSGPVFVLWSSWRNCRTLNYFSVYGELIYKNYNNYKLYRRDQELCSRYRNRDHQFSRYLRVNLSAFLFRLCRKVWVATGRVTLFSLSLYQKKCSNLFRQANLSQLKGKTLIVTLSDSPSESERTIKNDKFIVNNFYLYLKLIYFRISLSTILFLTYVNVAEDHVHPVDERIALDESQSGSKKLHFYFFLK